MKGLNGWHTDHALRVIVPTIRFPIVLIAHAGQGVVKVTAHHFVQHDIGNGTALAGAQYGP